MATMQDWILTLANPRELCLNRGDSPLRKIFFRCWAAPGENAAGASVVADGG